MKAEPDSANTSWVPVSTCRNNTALAHGFRRPWKTSQQCPGARALSVCLSISFFSVLPWIPQPEITYKRVGSNHDHNRFRNISESKYFSSRNNQSLRNCRSFFFSSSHCFQSWISGIKKEWPRRLEESRRLPSFYEVLKRMMTRRPSRCVHKIFF